MPFLVLLISLLAACSDRSAEQPPGRSPEQNQEPSAEQPVADESAGVAAETQAEAGARAEVVARAGAPLFEGMGDHEHPVTTTDPWAQKYFNQGLILDFAFNHAESVRSFKAAQTLDANCAMCFWGEALVLGPNINLPMQEDAVAPAFAASSRRGIVGISG